MSTECSWGSQRYPVVRQSCYRTMPAFSASRDSSAFLLRGCSILPCKLHGTWHTEGYIKYGVNYIFVLIELVFFPVVVLLLWKMSYEIHCLTFQVTCFLLRLRFCNADIPSCQKQKGYHGSYEVSDMDIPGCLPDHLSGPGMVKVYTSILTGGWRPSVAQLNRACTVEETNTDSITRVSTVEAWGKV